MRLKVLHLNTEFGGKDLPGQTEGLGRLELIADYINKHDYDLLGLQEVSGNVNIDKGKFIEEKAKNCFEYYKTNLKNFSGQLFPLFVIADIPDSYWGLSSFYNKDKFKLLDTKMVFTNDENRVQYKELKPEPQHNPVGFLSLKLKYKKSNKILYFITGHLTWGPVAWDDTKTQQNRAGILLNYMKTLTEPVICTLDMNVEWSTKTATQFTNHGFISLSEKYQINNTVNPNLNRHYKSIFIDDPISSKKGGVACDNIYISADIKDIKYCIVKEDLSDHYGIDAEFELVD